MHHNWTGLIAVGAFGFIFGSIVLWQARRELHCRRQPEMERIASVFLEAMEDARTTGYNEAIEDAEKCRRDASDVPITVDRARALASAATTEEPK